MPMSILQPSLALLVCLFLLPALLSGCGGSAESSTVPYIDQDGLKFRPRKVTIPPGTTVTFKNSETALHTININGKTESGSMKKGDTFDRRFDTPGSYRIGCEYHTKMRATVEVR